MVSNSLSESRVWFITGCTQGLGRGLLEEVLASKQRAVAAVRNPTGLAPLVEKYPVSQLLVVTLDLKNEARVASVFEQVKNHFGRLDVVVNNAGYGLEGEIEGTTTDAAKEQFDVLYWGPVYITRESVKFMRDINPPGHGGIVVNISSFFGYTGQPTFAFYCSAKSALESFTESFIKEMIPSWNIRGVVIEPGGFRTEWNKNSMVDFPIHPKYDVPGSPTLMFRHMVRQPFSGDPSKFGKAIMQIVDIPDLPLRIQLGTDSMTVVRALALRTVQDCDKYAELAHSTNFDGIDKEMVAEAYQSLFG
ncbi:hypothetical protein B0H21DRAFT_39447 [Amylocystis lapponica]|nr:hypothetical protein B0H21DRAFT_39447 [Amylocystis lapponica]